jgi:acyl carrier protein
MPEHELIELLRATLARVEPRRAEAARGLVRESTLVGLGLDSLCVTAMAGQIEDRLDIILPDEEIAPVVDVGSFIDLIQRHIRTSKERAGHEQP